MSPQKGLDDISTEDSYYFSTACFLDFKFNEGKTDSPGEVSGHRWGRVAQAQGDSHLFSESLFLSVCFFASFASGNPYNNPLK